MNRITLGKLTRSIFGLCLCISCFAFGSAAQTGSVTTANSPAAKPLSPIDEYQTKLGKLAKDNPVEFVKTLSEFINKYPYSERAVSYFYSLKTVTSHTKDGDEARSILNSLIKNTEQLPAPASFEVYRYIGEAFFSKGFYQDSADLAQKIIDIPVDEAAYVEFKKKQQEMSTAEYIAKTPTYKPRAFDEERAKSSFIGVRTGSYNLLAKSLWEQGRFEPAEKAYRDSFAIKVTKESALGIARSAEKNGRHDDTLKYATFAALTGKLDPSEMDYFYSTYAKLHQGRRDGVEEYLDTEFKKTYHNPVTGEKYKTTAKRSDRTVLAEFFTGAGCVPCIAYDYTFEKVLEDYSSKDVALLVYHWHAPTMDPLGNHSSDSRVKYYGVNGAPTLFVDGDKFEKDLDYNGGPGEQNKIQQTSNLVNENLEKDLEVSADAKINLTAKADAQRVSVEVEADKIKNVSDDVTLQIALIENETAYSGENGLRFQFMVVRALAGDNEKRTFGFKVDPSKPNKFEYVFDVYQVVAQNFAYYDTQASERMKEFLNRMGGKLPEGFNIDFKFNYKKNQIDSNNLSVIAFLQDNKTKKILQSSVVDLATK